MVGLKGYPKWICWVQGGVTLVLIKYCLWGLVFLMFLSGLALPMYYKWYWKNKPVTKKASPVCTEEKAAAYRKSYMEAMTVEEEEDIAETIRVMED